MPPDQDHVEHANVNAKNSLESGPKTGAGMPLGSGIFNAVFENRLDRILSPFEHFIHRQTTSGLLLMISAIFALFLANSPYASAYQHFIHTDFSLTFGAWNLSMSLGHWINDALMTLFFFVVGLELKREFLVGELAKIRHALLPLAAAIGGMVVPALIYVVFNPSGEAAMGWGVPMATDIAFAVGALALLAGRVPKGLITFLVALAIVDDLGAVLVIALFYTETIALIPLAIATGLFAMLIMFNLTGIRNSIPYFIIAIFLWYFLLLSGVHATIAGVLGAMTIPTTPKYNPAHFSTQVGDLMGRFNKSYQSHPDQTTLTNTELRGIVQALDNTMSRVQAPLQRLEYGWHLPVAFLVIPIFALANAGIAIDLGAFGQTMTHPVVLGVSLGLVLGKFIGITGASWLVLKMGVAVLPNNTRFSQIAGVSLLAGIGFTMSIFVAQLGFANNPEFLLMAKTGILLASILSGVLGFIWLFAVSKPEGD